MLLPVTILYGIELLRIPVTDERQNDSVLVIYGCTALFPYYLSYQAYTHPDLFDTLPESVLENSNTKSKSYQDHKCSAENSITIKTFMMQNELFTKQNYYGTFLNPYTAQPPPSFFTPNFTRIVSNKHHFVNADCIKFTPMNTVNHNQFILT